MEFRYLNREQELSTPMLNTPSSLTLFLCTVPPNTLFIICYTHQTHKYTESLLCPQNRKNFGPVCASFTHLHAVADPQDGFADGEYGGVEPGSIFCVD